MAPSAILSVKYLAAPSAGAARTGINGFLRYIQYRDHHADVERSTSRMLRYVGYRDPSSTRGQLFDHSGRAGDLERKALVGHVRRSLGGLSPTSRPQRAVYRFVLSPADARGLDLRELARTTMGALERDAGPLPPWLAAINRNTQHPHVHIVMAARREVAPDRFRTLMVTRPRLARMKEAMTLEMTRQLERSPAREARAIKPLRESVHLHLESGESVMPRRMPSAEIPHRQGRDARFRVLTDGLRRAARRYQRHIERQQLEEERRLQREQGGWER